MCNSWNRAILVLIIFLSCLSCKKPKNNDSAIDDLQSKITFQFIKTVEIQEDKENVYIDYKGQHPKEKIKKVDLPIEKCLVMNTSGCAFLENLGLIQNITGVASPEYIYSSKINELIDQNKIEIVGNDQNWDFEKIVQTKCKFIFCNYSPSLENTYSRLGEIGIHIIYLDEYKEENPLARTEFIKLIGSLFNKERAADSLFQTIKTSYEKVKVQAENINYKPSVFAKIMYGDTWFMPGGKSYSAELYKDAGANYLWKENASASSINLSYEEVFKVAHSADIWMDVSDIQTIENLEMLSSNYKDFKAFKNRQIYSLNGRLKGKANDFYESGVIYSNKVLKELYYIFKNYNHIQPDSLYYYKKL